MVFIMEVQLEVVVLLNINVLAVAELEDVQLVVVLVNKVPLLIILMDIQLFLIVHLVKEREIVAYVMVKVLFKKLIV